MLLFIPINHLVKNACVSLNRDARYHELDREVRVSTKRNRR